MRSRLLASLVVFAATAALVLLQLSSPKEIQKETASPGDTVTVASAPLDSAPREASPAAQLGQGNADRSELLAIEQEHLRHPEGVRQNNVVQVAAVSRFAEQTNNVLAKEPLLTHLRFTLDSVDCRENSCLAHMRFLDFGSADAFFRMMEDGRLAPVFKQVSAPKCPPVRRAVPRIPGEVQPNAEAVLHFECQ